MKKKKKDSNDNKRMNRTQKQDMHGVMEEAGLAGLWKVGLEFINSFETKIVVISLITLDSKAQTR